jgi:hypothetical protein
VSGPTEMFASDYDSGILASDTQTMFTKVRRMVLRIVMDTFRECSFTVNTSLKRVFVNPFHAVNETHSFKTDFPFLILLCVLLVCDIFFLLKGIKLQIRLGLFVHPLNNVDNGCVISVKRDLSCHLLAFRCNSL